MSVCGEHTNISLETVADWGDYVRDVRLIPACRMDHWWCPMKGQTTRLVLRALIDLSEGHDVTIVGFDAEQSGEIAARVVRIARGLGIPCRNSGVPDGPKVRIRPFGTEPPVITRGRVWIDHRAAFERGNVRPPAERSVFA